MRKPAKATRLPYQNPVVSHPRMFRIQRIRIQIQTIRTQFESVSAQSAGRFVPAETFSDDQNLGDSTKYLTRECEQTSIVTSENILTRKT